jgi:hypothetical protein
MLNKKILVEKINKLLPIEQEEIFKIIKRFNIKYTENNNGVFINLSNNIDTQYLEEIENYLNYLEINKTNIKDIEQICTNITNKQKIDDKNNFKLYYFNNNYLNNYILKSDNYDELLNYLNKNFLLKHKNLQDKTNNYLNIIKKYNRIITIKYLNLYDNNKNIDNNLQYESYLL